MNSVVWEVELKVTGPIKVSNNISFQTEKGFAMLPFYSDINIKSINNGIKATVTAYADRKDLAYSAAYVFFGQMIDVLSFQINEPLFLHYYENSFSINHKTEIKRVLKKENFGEAFQHARELLQNNQTLLKAYGWYRKGLTTENPYDQLLAFWNVIEIIVPKYHNETERSKIGIINKTWKCFLDIWGDQNTWPVIGGQVQWINNVCELRNHIAHGVREINLESIMEIIEYVGDLEKLSRRLLQEINKLHYEWGGFTINKFNKDVG